MALSLLLDCMFQSTHPRGVRRVKDCRLHRRRVFQSTHPRGVRLENGFVSGTISMFQSTHPRGVRRRRGGGYVNLYCVSIHAPARGATVTRQPAPAPSCGFNPRTREGCDANPGLVGHVLRGFNPRTREGCDAKALAKALKVSTVSIHAPARGATKKRQGSLIIQGRFNPRTREGCDIGWAAKTIYADCFNPRTREGCDRQSRALWQK